jgi:hypothetical protein
VISSSGKWWADCQGEEQVEAVEGPRESDQTCYECERSYLLLLVVMLR